MNKNVVLLVIIIFLIGLSSGYFLSNPGAFRKLSGDGKIANPKLNTGAIIALDTIKNVAIRDKYANTGIQKNNPLFEKVSLSFKYSQISEDFLGTSIDYIGGTTDFLPETKQLFKNLNYFIGKIGNDMDREDDGSILDNPDSIKYLIPFLNLKNIKNFAVTKEELLAYQTIQNNFNFLRDPILNKNSVVTRLENQAILDWKNGKLVTNSIKGNDYYLRFLLTDVSRSLLKIDILKEIPENINDIYKISHILTRYGIDLLYTDMSVLDAQSKYREYMIDNSIDYFLIDKSLLLRKDLCSEILNPKIAEICKYYVANNFKNDKYERITKEYMLYKYLYMDPTN